MTYKTIQRTPWVLKYQQDTVRLIENAPTMPPEFAHFKHVFWFQAEGEEPFALALHPDGRYAINTPHACSFDGTFRIISIGEEGKEQEKIRIQYNGTTAPILEAHGWLVDVPDNDYAVSYEIERESAERPSITLYICKWEEGLRGLVLYPDGTITCVRPHNCWPISNGWIAYFFQNEKTYEMPKSASIRLKPPPA